MLRLAVNYGGGINLANKDACRIENFIRYDYLFSNEIKFSFSNNVYVKFTENFSYIYENFGYFYDISIFDTVNSFELTSYYTSVTTDNFSISIEALTALNYLTSGSSPSLWAYLLRKDDQIYGSSYADKIFSSSGNDTIFGYGGNDTLAGDSGHDDIREGTGNDIFFGVSRIDYLEGNDGGDNLYDANDTDFFLGGYRSNWLYGQLGDDNIYWEWEKIWLESGSGNNLLKVFNNSDYLPGVMGTIR